MGDKREEREKEGDQWPLASHWRTGRDRSSPLRVLFCRGHMQLDRGEIIEQSCPLHVTVRPAGGRGREREGQGAYLGPWLERGGRRAGWPLEAGPAGEGASGGGDAQLRRGLGSAVEVVVVVERGVEAYL